MDVSRPEIWHRKRLEAIVAIQQGDDAKAAEWIRFVREHRGNAVANQTKRTIRAVALSEPWAKFDEKRGQTVALKTLLALDA